MSVMWMKQMLRRRGFDLVRYHPLYEHLLAKERVKTVFDIGASNGQFAHGIRSLLPEAYIYSFEPLGDVYEELTHNFAHDTRFKAFRMGLGDTNGTLTIHRSSFSPSSSFLQMSDLHKKLFPKTAGSSNEEVTVRRLDDVSRELDIHDNLLIKMDVQGFEDKVIKGGMETIARTRMLVIETSFVPLYEGQLLFDDIVVLLRPLGFSYRGTREQHWDERTGEPLYQDSIFMRS